MQYTIPKGTRVYRTKYIVLDPQSLATANAVPGLHALPWWEFFTTEKFVTYQETDRHYTKENRCAGITSTLWYIFTLPQIASPYLFLAVEQALFHGE